MSKILRKPDLDIPCKNMALYLLGKVLVRKMDHKTILKGRIIETECYLGGDDKASNTYGGRRTPANEPMYMDSGTAFVYMTYGMYHCINISSKEPGAAVLLRSLEPLDGEETMQKNRVGKRKTKKDFSYPAKDLCNGPSKLCMSLDIRKDNCNKLDVTDSEVLWIEDDGFKNDFKVVETSRIGIDRAGKEWASKPLRFYILGNNCVSKRDVKAEESLESQ